VYRNSELPEEFLPGLLELLTTQYRAGIGHKFVAPMNRFRGTTFLIVDDRFRSSFRQQKQSSYGARWLLLFGAHPPNDRGPGARRKAFVKVSLWNLIVPKSDE